MKNIHVIPTDKPSRLFIDIDDHKLKITQPICGEYMMNQHIYITNSEEIKEGDWYINLLDNRIWKAEPNFINTNGIIGSKLKKIILTTDAQLIKDCVQAIDDTFLEWFVENPSCEEIEVKKETLDISTLVSDYKKYPNLEVIGYKIIIPQEETKQDTLEEAAENYGWRVKINTFSDSVKANELAESAKQDFISGAKYQAEKVYSEEELREAIRFGFDKGFCSNSSNKMKNLGLSEQEWFEQFKKKV